nr:hypothetical protein Q903MT_gene1174 [Picea sitchensis]
MVLSLIVQRCKLSLLRWFQYICLWSVVPYAAWISAGQPVRRIRWSMVLYA